MSAVGWVCMQNNKDASQMTKHKDFAMKLVLMEATAAFLEKAAEEDDGVEVEEEYF